MKSSDPIAALAQRLLPVATITAAGKLRVPAPVPLSAAERRLLATERERIARAIEALRAVDEAASHEEDIVETWMRALVESDRAANQRRQRQIRIARLAELSLPELRERAASGAISAADVKAAREMAGWNSEARALYNSRR